jgi:hypothetical protein
MRRLLVLLGLLGLGVVVTRRLLRTTEGTITRGAQQAANTIRRLGPGAVDRAAQGVESLGEAAEEGVQRIRRRMSEGEELAAEEAEEQSEEEEREATRDLPPTDVPEAEP